MYTDETLNCVDCNSPFIFSSGEQQFFASKGFQNKPNRCPECRSARKAQRGSGGGGGGGGGAPIRHQSGNVPMNRNHVFDSIGVNLRIRGTSQQLFEKYLQLGRDATSSGDRVMAESYFQYAEHYFRILNAMNQAAQQNSQQTGQQGNQQNGQPPQQNYQPYSGQNHQRRVDEPLDDQQGFDDDEQDGSDQPAIEMRPIPINAGNPDS